VSQKYAWLWDVDMDPEAFERILADPEGVSVKQRQWAVVRLIEYAPWPEIQRLLPRDFFLKQWPELAPPCAIPSAARWHDLPFTTDVGRNAFRMPNEWEKLLA